MGFGFEQTGAATRPAITQPMTMKAMPNVTKMPRCLEGMLGEHGRDDRDARANAKAGDETERAEERVVRRKSLGKGKQTIEDNCDREHLLTADHVGEDTSTAPQEPCRAGPSSQRAGQSRDGLTSSNLSCKERRCDIGVGGIDDHEVVAVENHGERQEDEYDPCVGGNARTVNDFGNSKPLYRPSVPP